MARLKESYVEEIRPELVKRVGSSSYMEAPTIETITLTRGLGDA